MAGIDTYTKLLLHMSGADGATTFADSSDAASSVTAKGSAQVDTAQYKFVESSLLLNGSTDYLEVADSDNWQFTGDMCIDFWVRFNSLPTVVGDAYMFYAQRVDGNNGHWLELRNTAGNLFLNWMLWEGSQKFNIFNAVTLLVDTWYHIAFCRTSGTLKTFLNGTQVGSDATYATAFPNFAAVALIGANNHTTPNLFLDGWIDEFRISNGTSRYTANFTVETEQYFNERSITETITVTDAITTELVAETSLSESLTLTDESFGYSLTAYITETFYTVDYTGSTINDSSIDYYIRFPNLSGQHLTLRFNHANFLDENVLYYIRMKMFKSVNRTGYECKFPNLSGQHLKLRLQNSAEEDHILEYVSLGLFAKRE